MQPGVAYATFKDHQGAENALLCSGTRIGGSAVTVTMAPNHQLFAEALASTNIAGHTSPILSASRNVFELCMVSKEGNFELIIFVNGTDQAGPGTDMGCLDDVTLDSFCRTTGASIHVSKMLSLDAYMVKVR
ncbi:unnamed protein product, partial [Arabidopsis halleri]